MGAMEAHAAGMEDDVARPGWWEFASVVVLVVAGTGLPIIGWAVGMGLVFLSDVWTTRDKAIAVAAPLWAVIGLVAWSAVARGTGGGFPLGMSPAAVLLLLGGAVAGLLGALYLTWRAFALA
jgi:hypothetical protein